MHHNIIFYIYFIKGGDFIYNIPSITPLSNLTLSCQMLNDLYKYQYNKWSVGQLYPDGGPDSFTCFFSTRNIPIYSYLRGNIAIGHPTAYEKDIYEIREYIKFIFYPEVNLVKEMISTISAYESNCLPIGVDGPDGGYDEFVIFFSQRDLPIKAYLNDCDITIGEPTAYEENIVTLEIYLQKIQTFEHCVDPCIDPCQY